MRTVSLVSLVAFASFASACASNPPLAPPPKAPDAVPWTVPIAPPVSSGPRITPDAPYRDQPPQPEGSITFAAPNIESFSLANGMKVLLVQRHELPIVSVRVVLKAGAGDIAGVRPGVMSFLGAMMEQGTLKRSALQLSDDYEAIGANHHAWVEWDSAGAALKILATQLDSGLEIMSDVLLHPAFPQAEVDRLKARRLAALQAEKNNPRSIVGNVVAPALYGRAHPYGHSLSGREDDAKKLTRAEIVRLYERVFAPANATIIVAGDVTPDVVKEKLERYFGAWKGGPAAARTVPNLAPPRANEARVVFVDKPRATQSQVYLVDTGVAKSSPDRDALTVMNAILGGMFTSRINLNLREKHAYAYGAHSHFTLRHGPGPFMAGGSMHAEHTLDAVKELLSEVKRIRGEAVSADELAEAKESIKLALPGQFESVDAVTGALSDIAVYDLPLDEYATRVARIEAITAADVKRVANALLRPDRMKVIIVGDKKQFEPGLKGLELGRAEERDAYGDVH